MATRGSTPSRWSPSTASWRFDIALAIVVASFLVFATSHIELSGDAVLLWITGYAVFGTMVAVLLRSVPVALGVGIAWAGPIEHIVQDSWSTANRVFPGLLLEAFVGGGNADVSSGRALLTVTVYALVAAAIGVTVFARRDVTA